MDESAKQVNWFRMCQGCGSHGRFVNTDETIQDCIVVHSKQAAQDRLRVMQDYGFISDEDAVRAIGAINASGLPDELTEGDHNANLEEVDYVPREFLAPALLMS